MSDAELLEGFHGCTLTHAEWTHRAHVRVGYLFVREHGFEEGLVRVRAGIKKLNGVHGTPETETRGYNETTTRALLHIIAAVMGAYGKAFPVKTSDEFYEIHPQMHTKHVLRLYYSPERRMHPRAKVEFVEPDLSELPRIHGGD